MNVLDNIRSNKFLLNGGFEYTGPGKTLEFVYNDTLEDFNKNLLTQPEDWYYRSHSVTYTLNSYGYRAPEFETIDWAKSVVVLGSSDIFGVGLDDKDTITSHLEKMIGCPVINLGTGGTGIDFILYNSIILKNLGVKPRTVICTWPSVYRTTYFLSNKIVLHSAWQKQEQSYFEEWVKETSHAQTQAVFASMIIKHMWRDTKFFEASNVEETAKLLNCYNILPSPQGETARDLRHRGRENTYNAAKLLLSIIQ